MDKPTPRGGLIETMDQATARVRKYAAMAIHWRGVCHEMGIINEQTQRDPDATDERKETTVRELNAAYQQWLMHYGSAVGALVSLHRVGLIPENAYDLLIAEVYATIQPKVVGTIDNPVPPKGGIVLV